MPATPTYVVQHTYIGDHRGSSTSRMHHRTRPMLVMTNRIEDHTREADCSGRALATLVIAWVGAALIASVLLKWTHMWVALAVLTLLFLAACGYAACDARRTQQRALAMEADRQQERRRRRDQQLESISGGIDNYPEIIDPPDYQSYWVADLPPSYTSAVGTTQTLNNANSLSQESEELTATNVSSPRLSNPPPYSVAVQSEPLFIPTVLQSGDNSQSQLQNNTETVNIQTENNGETTSSQTVRIPAPIRSRDEDKVEDNNQNTLNSMPSQTRTQYLTSILNSTFGRNVRRTNNNNSNIQEQNNSINNNNNNNNNINNSTATIVDNNRTSNFTSNGDNNNVRQINNGTQSNHNREENIVLNNSLNNNDRNNNSNVNNNNGPGTASPSYPISRLSSD